MGRKAGQNRSGLDFENTVARHLLVRGASARRAVGAPGDVVATVMGGLSKDTSLLIECKCSASPPRIRGALEQCRDIVAHARPNRTPVAVCRTKGKPKETVVAMYWEDFLDLLLGKEQT